MAGRNPSSLLAGNEDMVRVKRAVDGRSKNGRMKIKGRGKGKGRSGRKKVSGSKRHVKTRRGSKTSKTKGRTKRGRRH